MNVSCNQMPLNIFKCILDTRLKIIERNLTEEEKQKFSKDVQTILAESDTFSYTKK